MVVLITRCSSGIEGLDKILLEGYPKGRTFLIEGQPGAGKTLMSWHFIRSGIYKEPKEPEHAIYVCLDSRPKDMIEDVQSIFTKWDIRKTIERGQLLIIDGYSGRLGYKPEGAYGIPTKNFNIETVIQTILAAQKEIGAQRLVVDPVSRLFKGMESHERDKAIDKFTFLLSSESIPEKMPVTTLLTAESSEGHFSNEQYGAHGVIRLSFEKRDRTKVRILEIMKMRRTMHSMDYVEYQIGVEGIEVLA